MAFLQNIKAIWQRISLVQKALLAAIIVACGITSALLVYWAGTPKMRLLYQGLDPADAAKITDKIADKGMPYELRGGGTTIYVPEKDLYKLRLDLAKEGLPAEGQGGYKIFDNEKIGISPFVQNINLNRALQEELAKTIQMIEGVEYARVHLVRSEQSVFSSQSQAPTASVVLRLKPAYRLSPGNIAAITHLLAGSTPGLLPENITVVDSTGQLLSNSAETGTARGAGTVLDYKERVEQSLARKAEDMLAEVLGPGRASVKVSAVVNMESINLVTETYDPTQKVATKEEIKSKSKTAGQNTAKEGQTPGPDNTEMDETTTMSYVVGKTVQEKVQLPGQIASLSVSAVVDLSVPKPAEAENKEQTEKTSAAEGEMIMSVDDVKVLLRNALGLGEKDSLEVKNVKFYRPPEQIIEKTPNWPYYIDIARQLSLGLAAVCALLALKIFGGAARKLAQPAGQVEAIGLLQAGGEDSEQAVLRRQITGALQQNPDQVRQLFNSWLQEGTER